MDGSIVCQVVSLPASFDIDRALLPDEYSGMPKLLFTNKNFEEQVYELVVERTTVGRGQKNTLVICDNSVSMTHCEILMNGTEIIVRDLDSSNGTFVEGARLKPQSQAKNGQTIRFGLVEARLQLEAPVDDDTENITAVYDLAKFQREQRRELKKQKVNIHGTIEPSASVESESHTVLLPRPVQPQFRPTGETEPPARKTSLKAVVIIAAAVLAAIILVVLMWSR